MYPPNAALHGSHWAKMTRPIAIQPIPPVVSSLNQPGEIAKLTNLTAAPKDLVWSPDGRSIAFSMLVEDKPEPFVTLPEKPEGAEWAEPAKMIQKTRYRSDGAGYLKDGFHQLFVLSADGQSTVVKDGYIPISAKLASQERDKLD